MHRPLEQIIMTNRAKKNIIILLVISAIILFVAFILVKIGVDPKYISPGMLGIISALCAVMAAWRLGTLKN